MEQQFSNQCARLCRGLEIIEQRYRAELSRLRLLSEKSVLPMLRSILSEALLLTNSCHPILDYDRDCYAVGSLEEKQTFVTDVTLKLVFETETRLKLQRIDAVEVVHIR
jgi:hypothetical protein